MKSNSEIACGSGLIVASILATYILNEMEIQCMEVGDIASGAIDEWLESEMDIESFLWSHGADVNKMREYFNVKSLRELIERHEQREE